ncbi:MAG: hypothetical protein LC804_11145, partial [Acidobacteria bacterium]|nr:hypothetical protein [Acidobacteriota bacterium]
MSLSEQLDRLAAVEPVPFPFISLYLNTQPDQHGRDNFEPFVRKEFKERSRGFAVHSTERESLDRDIERINQYLAADLKPSANGLAIFACAGADEFFEAVQLTAPIDEHRLYISDQPQLYPLARLESQYPRYAALLADTNSARLFVFSTGELIDQRELKNVKTRRTSMGGWSQARSQRHVENYHLHHAKEVVDMLDKVVRAESIPHVILAGDEVIVPLLREQLPQHLSDKIVDVVRLDVDAPEQDVLATSLKSLKRQAAESEREKVESVVGSYRA